MKTLKLQLILLLVFSFFISCKTELHNNTKVEERLSNMNGSISVVQVDSCEYIVCSSNGISIIHKQNCKFCVIRNKKDN